jgi:acyl-CoA synthetase (AMP-forming)/AMP-acid ligase II
MNLGDAILHNGQYYGTDPAILFEGRRITYGAFAGRVRQLAGAFGARGLAHQARIAVLAHNCPEYLEIYGAAAVGGFIGVGINYRLSAPEQAEVLNDCQPSVMVFEACFSHRVAELRSKISETVVYVCIGVGPSWAIQYDALLLDGSVAGVVRSSDDDMVYMSYTSGTTSRPKGVMLSNGGQLDAARALAAAQGVQQNDRMLIVMPFYHIGGLIELLAYFVYGATIVLHRTFEAQSILKSIESHRVSAAHFAPTMIQMMLEVQEEAPYDVSSLKTVCYASAPMSIALTRRATAVFGPVFMQIYAMTELAAGTALLKHHHVLEGPEKEVARLASAGKPLLGTELRIADSDGNPCAPGEVGEIWMRGKSVMQGYWNNPTASAAAMHGDWLRTGDVGRLDEDNFLFVVDRMKDMVISGGENIYSREVEEALLLHPDVREAAVIGVPDEKWGESVKAFIVLKAGSTTTESSLVDHCRTLIASYKKPQSVEFVDMLPRTPSTNKVDKKKLREPFWSTRGRNVA